MTIETTKKNLRNEAKRLRAGAAKLYGIKAAEAAARHGATFLGSIEKGSIIAGYWPLGEELDPRFLMHTLEKIGYRIALPVVSEKDTPLVFRLWGQGDPLQEGAYGILEPDKNAPEVIPDALLAPLLAFDKDCYRLGWGGGFYDRTLAANTSIKAFGFAYAAQFLEDLPRGVYDWPMHAIITDEGIILPQKALQR